MKHSEYRLRNALIRDRNLQAIDRARIIAVQYDLRNKNIFDKKLKEVAKNAYSKEKYIPKKYKKF
jgi:hypothetical protein